MNILLVENSGLVSERLAAVLSSLDYVDAVSTASSHEEAVRLMHAMPQDILVTNAHLPDGEAFRVLAWVQAHHPSIRRIVMSCDLSDIFQKRWLQAGAEHVLDMPIQTDELIKIVRMTAEHCMPDQTRRDTNQSAAADTKKGDDQ